MESNRRIVMFNWMTANGYFAGADGNLDWVVPDEQQVKAAVDSIPLFDTVLFGRRTYELFEKFWSHAVDDSSTAPDPHHAGERTKENRAIAIWLNDANKVVFSKSLKHATWKNSRVLHELDPREIETMKSQPGKDMMIFGSGTIVSQLTQHGLIDEYQFVLCPVLLGNGRPLLSNVSKDSRLDLVEAKQYKSGDVMLRYARAK
jgi:dihydrofolate reductase